MYCFGGLILLERIFFKGDKIAPQRTGKKYKDFIKKKEVDSQTKRCFFHLKFYL
jgi:hypothetical protein